MRLSWGGSRSDDLARKGRRVGRFGVRLDIARVTRLDELTVPGCAQQGVQALPVWADRRPPRQVPRLGSR
jgi:hypothetical protein